MQNLVFEDEAQGGGMEGSQATESPLGKERGKLRGQVDLRKPPSYALALDEPTAIDQLFFFF